MTKTILMLLLVFSATCSFAQNPQSADSLIIKELILQVKSLTELNENNNKTIKILLSSRDFDVQTKYNLIKNNLINSAETFELLSKKTADLRSRISSNRNENLIKELNNPTGDALGFNFNSQILRLVGEHIQPTKKSTGKKIVNAIEGVTKSPIVTTIPAMIPAISISNAVIGILRCTSVFDDQVDEAKIKNFENALNKYTQYYRALAEADQNFNVNLTYQKEQLAILQENIYHKIDFFARTLGYPVPDRRPDEKAGDYMNRFFIDFNKSYLEKMFAELEQKHSYGSANNRKINYEEILKNQSLKNVNNGLEEFVHFINQFEFMYNEYFNVLEKYNTCIVKALDVAKQNGIADPLVVDSKKKEFEETKNVAISEIKTSIDLTQLLLSKKKINYTARIF